MNSSITNRLVTTAVIGLSLGYGSGMQENHSSGVQALSVVEPALVAPLETGASDNTPLSVMLEHAASFHEGGEYQQAIATYQLLLRSPNIPVALRADLLRQIADINIERGMYVEAEAQSRQAIAGLRRAHKEHTAVFAIAERILADALSAEGYAEEARETAEDALSVGRETLDTSSPDFAFILTSLGQIAEELGKLAQAEQLCQSALQILQRTATHRVDLATAHQNAANIQVLRGHPRKALATIDRALAVWSQVLPPEHPSVVYALITKMTVYAKLKAFRQGEELMPHVLSLDETLLGYDHPERVILLNNAAAFYVAEKKYGDAEPLLREAVRIAQHQLGPGHPRTKNTLLNYSYVLAKLNRKNGAALVKAESQVVRAGQPEIDPPRGHAKIGSLQPK